MVAPISETCRRGSSNRHARTHLKTRLSLPVAIQLRGEPAEAATSCSSIKVNAHQYESTTEVTEVRASSLLLGTASTRELKTLEQ